jgi:predicted nucleic-acid-binding Zn-ribbon protein
MNKDYFEIKCCNCGEIIKIPFGSNHIYEGNKIVFGIVDKELLIIACESCGFTGVIHVQC